jgi:hypothetical protein
VDANGFGFTESLSVCSKLAKDESS